ncbi:caspase recruitment domain-containing protein 9-like [Candoia aspera]|uniref:caspase recruitment domain-containing protein 9-like n=1 Tax=Candoia aspera TaxID=51853 RepID=UPI002FD81366
MVDSWGIILASALIVLLQALLTQEGYQKQYSQSLRDKDSYRKQIRDLGERCDELQLQLFQKEGQLLSAEAKLKRLCVDPSALTSDLEENSSRSSQELAPHGNPDEDGKGAKASMFICRKGSFLSCLEGQE